MPGRTIQRLTAQARRPNGLGRALIVLVLLLLVGIGAVDLSFCCVPTGNTPLQHFSTLLVLGAPSTEEGSVGIEQRWRLDEAIREFHRGRADHIIVSGGAVFNRFVEAHTMAAYAQSQGIPASAIVEEPRSRNTVENLFDSQAIMDAKGWPSVEVISSPEHLPRTGLLLRHTHLLWRTHAAPTPGRGESDIVHHTVAEALATAAIRIFGLHSTSTLHKLKLRVGV